MILKKKKKEVPDFQEFTDDEGKKWIQTSTDDLFSVKELNDIIESVENEKVPGEIVLARIDFKKVNKEYYDKVQELQQKLKKRTELLNKLVAESRRTVDKKNQKLKELIAYIKKLHVLLAYYKQSPEEFQKIEIPSLIYKVVSREAPVIDEKPGSKPMVYTEVEEVLLDDEGNEMGTV
ncbi:MAG TPA: hypothetical protein VKQ10_01995 [Spirochaetota bacterium]|nr:hypothetical protein [Spirochaetota bacterium]